MSKALDESMIDRIRLKALKVQPSRRRIQACIVKTLHPLLQFGILLVAMAMVMPTAGHYLQPTFHFVPIVVATLI